MTTPKKLHKTPQIHIRTSTTTKSHVHNDQNLHDANNMQRVYVTPLFPRYYAKMRRTKGRRVVFVFVPQLRECCFLRTCVCVHNVGFHFQLVSWTNGRKVSRCGVFRTRFLFIGGFLRKWEFSGFRMCLIENG